MLLRCANVCNFAATSDNSHYVKYITYSLSLDNVASKHIIRESRTFGAVIGVRFEPRDAICSVVFALRDRLDHRFEVGSETGQSERRRSGQGGVGMITPRPRREHPPREYPSAGMITPE